MARENFRKIVGVNPNPIFVLNVYTQNFESNHTGPVQTTEPPKTPPETHLLAPWSMIGMRGMTTTTFLARKSS